MSGSWFPVPIPGNRGTNSNRFSGTEGNHWEPLSREEKEPALRSSDSLPNAGWEPGRWKRLGFSTSEICPKYREVPWKAQELQVFSCCAERLRPERLGPNHRPPWVEPDRGEEPCLFPRRSRSCRRDRGVDGVGPAQRVPSGAAMPSVPKRPGAQEGQRSVGHRGQLRHDRARTRGGQCRTRQV